MKRFSSSDSLGSLLYSQEEKLNERLVYGTEFQAMFDGLDDEDSIEESGNIVSGKKRRLTVQQVQSLEKIFEVDNKLDPERKVKLAQELGLQPRQVAIWFQNRRARWKTKQLERDYNHLKANFENLQLNYSKIEQEKETLVAELKELKEKLGDQVPYTEWNHNSAGKATMLGAPNAVPDQCAGSFPGFSSMPETSSSSLHREVLKKISRMPINLGEAIEVPEVKDGSSDSDNSSGILINEHNSNNNLDSQYQNHQILTEISCSRTSSDASPPALCLSSSMYHPHHHQFLNSRPQVLRGQQHQQHHNVKLEELNLFSVEEPSCNIFSADQAANNNLYWYFPDQRS